ncbi:MAG: transcriptional repressor [Oscillospiraceae bacterium]|nr:transcriptional repressor [Oscillospiraceae bacterium]
MGVYQTKQRLRLISFLEKNTDRQLSASEIADGVCENGKGKSTVFRQIKSLCEEGNLQRFRGEDGKSVLYQYGGGKCHMHFHLKCVNCERIIHLDCDHIDHLKSHIKAEHGFFVDPAKTVLYGLCSNCKEAK